MMSLCVINLGVLLLILLAEKSDAACSETDPCVEELGQGQPFKQPVQIDGTKNDRIEMSVDIQELQFGWLKIKRRVYNGDPTGPTWNINKEQLHFQVTVKNLLSDLNNEQPGKHENDMNRPNTTNIHTHGLHISSLPPQDSVLIRILPGEEFVYKYCFHEEQPSGTYWYHAHVHGSTLLQVNSGMAGLIIVNDEQDKTPQQLWDVSCPDNCDTDIQMVIQGILQFKDGFGSFGKVQDECGDDPSFKQDSIMTNQGISLRKWLAANVGLMTVNGLLEPVLTMQKDKMYRFRMVNAAGYDTVEPLITNKGTNDPADACRIREIAYDGIYLDKPRELHQGQSVIVPGNRVDWLVICDKEGEYELRSYADKKDHKSFGEIRRWNGLLVSLKVVTDIGENQVGNSNQDNNNQNNNNGDWYNHGDWGHNGGWHQGGDWGHNGGGHQDGDWGHNGDWGHHGDWGHIGGWHQGNDRDSFGDRFRYRRSQLVEEMVEAAKDKDHEMELKRFFDHYGWGQGGHHGSNEGWGEPDYEGGENEDEEKEGNGEDDFNFDLPKRPYFVDDLRNVTEEEIKERFVMEFDTLLQLGRESWSSADNYRYAMTVNEMQEWHIINTDPEIAHPFHPHINSFQVISYNNYTGPFSIEFARDYVLYSQTDEKSCDFQRAGLDTIHEDPVPLHTLDLLGHDQRYAADAGDTAGYVRVGDWRDVLLIPPLVNITIRFVPDRYTGPLIIHCHLLSHEDAGMMMIAKIVHKPTKPSTTDYLLANITSGNAFPGTCRKEDRYPFNNPKRLVDLDPDKINELLHNNVRPRPTAGHQIGHRQYPWKRGREGEE